MSRWSRARPRAPMRRTRSRRRTMPVTLIVVPRPITVIVAPVRTDREGDDRQADHRPVAEHRHRIALIGVAEQPAVYPSACARQADVAPRIARYTAVYRYRHAGPRLRDDRVVGRRACPHIGRCIDDRLTGLRRRDAGQRDQRRQQGRGRDREWQGGFVHVHLPDSAAHGDARPGLRHACHAHSTGRFARWFAVMRNETLPEYCRLLRGRYSRYPMHAQCSEQTGEAPEKATRRYDGAGRVRQMARRMR